MESGFRLLLFVVEAVVVVALSALFEGSGVVRGDRWVVPFEAGELSLPILMSDHDVEFLWSPRN
jgi:hypothetical protein